MINLISILLMSFFPLILAQQPYIRQATTLCDSRDNSTSVLGYTCNGPTPSCRAYLTFRAEPPYASVSSISSLLSANSSEVAQLNSVSESTTFESDQAVLVPVTCSCSGPQYQTNASYAVRSGDTYLLIANNTFQGLSTCQALEVQNRIAALDLLPDDRLTVPLRCACPTRNQTVNGANYLLTYLIPWNRDLSTISQQVGVAVDEILTANGLSSSDIIFPFTTILIPLRNPPTPSQVALPPPSSTSPPVSPPSPGGGGGSSSSSNRTWVYALVGAVAGLILLFILGTIIFCLFFRRKKSQSEKAEPDIPSQSFESVEKPLVKDSDGENSRDFLGSLSSIAHSLKVYTFQELKFATEDFSPNCRITTSVYRGTINGDLAAIKKMKGDVSKEINLLNKINHFNLVRLSGVGFHEGDWYLIYEYASNGSLSDWILDESGEKKTKLNWNIRLQIALDIAAGLNYLHQYTSPPHVHKDLNSSNVLLDREFRAKIANFGLARSANGEDGQFALTRHIVGTKGYMAPEYLENGILSPKLDVYAFGVVLLEILTGKDVGSLYGGVDAQLSEVLSPVLLEDEGRESLRNLMDPFLGREYPLDLALVVLRLVEGCVKREPADRPDMDDVFRSLSRVLATAMSGELAVGLSGYQTGPR